MAQYHDDSCGNLAQTLGQFVRETVIPYEKDDRHAPLESPVQPMHTARLGDMALRRPFALFLLTAIDRMRRLNRAIGNVAEFAGNFVVCRNPAAHRP